MSPNTITASRIFKDGETSYLSWEKFPHVGLLKVHYLYKNISYYKFLIFKFIQLLVLKSSPLKSNAFSFRAEIFSQFSLIII